MTVQKAAFTRRRSPLLGLLVVGAASVWFAVSFVLASRDRVRNPYPAAQNGLTFIAQHDAHQPLPATRLQDFLRRVERRFTHASLVGSEWTYLEMEMPPGAAANDYTATGRSSTGDTFALDCGIAPLGIAFDTPANHFFVRLTQTGVPDTYRWVDVTVKDKKGHTGTWRMTRLPRLAHALPADTALIQETQTVQSIAVEGRAWWDETVSAYAPGGFGSRALPLVADVKALVPQTALTRPTQHWHASITHLTPEWDDQKRPTSDFQTGFVGLWRKSKPPGIAAVLLEQAQCAVAPHPSVQRALRIRGELNQYDKHEETVVFVMCRSNATEKGLRVKAGFAPQTTPSGIRVTLAQPSPLRPYDDPVQPTAVRLDLVYTPEGGVIFNSPLQKRVGNRRPLRVTAFVQWSSQTLSSIYTSGDDKTVRLIFQKRPASRVLPELKVIVSQEAHLQSLPFALVVPVKSGKPKEKWGAN